MASPLAGAWEIISDVYQGYVVFSENHYGDALAMTNRKLPQGDMPTEAEAWRSMMAVSGTYTISGSVVNWNEDFSRLPCGSPDPYEFSIDGDYVTMIDGNYMTMIDVHSGRGWRFRKAE